MNIKLQGIDLLGNLGLKSTQDRLNRQAERDNKIAFFEQQKENLKNMKADTIDEIARKLDLFHISHLACKLIEAHRRQY